MSTLGSGSLSPAAAPAPAPAVEDTSRQWAPHGAVLTACVVGMNVLMIVLIFFFFWRFFSGKRGDSAGADDDGKAPECAVCIVELRDGDSARRLPRCGHRFHAECVGAWLRLHASCPLCRASVVAPPAAAAAGEARNAKDGDASGADCPV